jgi:tetratricopeptide (TPR) repeat protein
LEEAEKQLLIGIDYCARANLPSYEVWSRVCLGEVYFDMGDFTRSQGQFEKAASICETIQFIPSWGCLSRAGVERSKAMIDIKDVNWETLPVLIQKNRMKPFEGLHQRYLGEIFLNIGDRHYSDAERCIRMAIEADRRNGMMLHLGRDHALCAELFKQKGDRSKFQEHLGKAIDLFKECGADGWLKKAEEEFATLS